jgi:hypothetical protein
MLGDEIQVLAYLVDLALRSGHRILAMVSRSVSSMLWPFQLSLIPFKSNDDSQYLEQPSEGVVPPKDILTSLMI